ncbi:MAG: glucose-1-phosphate thymidylyltransferase [Candidatus Binatia bacterium]
MKAIVLCAGLGTRLRPLTFSTAKHLIPVANKPVLFFGIESLVEIGAREIGIIVSKDSRSVIQNAIDDGQRWGAQVSYVEQPQPRGLAHAAQCARAFVGSDPFVMYLGDNLIPEGLTGAAEHFQRSGANAVVMLKAVDDPSQFGIAELDGDRIVRLVEKPKNPPTNLAIVGGYFFDRHIFESIDRIKPSWRNEFEITDAIQDLIDRGLTVAPYVVTGWWKDAGKPTDILEANQVMLQKIATAIHGKVDGASIIEGAVSIGPDAEITGSKIVGPTIIGAEARIIDAEIGPFASIGDRVRIISSRVADSVVMDDTVIQHVQQPVVRSLLGRRVQLTGKAAGREGLRLVLGDFCETELA